ncbi:hypothetical protein LTR94_025075 [Friedmanniomyces endolithicus]|nr:hypothetical protein LTR94_025075 [Friedmanniomyces endolithicus]
MRSSLDQLSVFIAVVDAGGFAAAARRLNRQQSAISYAISALEEQMGGIALFDRTTRRVTLTPTGEAVLADARRINADLDALRARVKGLQTGLEAELGLVIDVMAPAEVLVSVLADFRERFPTVRIRLTMEVLGGVPALVLNRACHIGVSGPLFYQTDGLEREQIGATTLLPVEAPTHALAVLEGEISSAEARRHDQVVLTDRSQLSQGRDFAVIGDQTLAVSDLATKYYLVRSAIGWGNLPEAMVREDLREGRLVHVPLLEWRARPYPLYAIYRSDAPPGPAGRWFVDRMARAYLDHSRG